MTTVYHVTRKSEVAGATGGRISEPKIPIGKGTWELLANLGFDMTLGPSYQVPVHIAIRKVDGKGSVTAYNLVDGYGMKDHPLCMSAPQFIEGPAKVYGVATFSEADWFMLQLRYRRVG